LSESHLHPALCPAYEACIERSPEPGWVSSVCSLFDIREKSQYRLR
jgi:hypothetical protein